MELKDYFDHHPGLGIISTADADGKVNAALYSRPHFMEDDTVAFIMRDRLTHANLGVNPNACYLFLEKGSVYKGKRLYLRKVREEKDSDLLYTLKRRSKGDKADDKDDPKFLVFFELERVLPLVSTSER